MSVYLVQGPRGARALLAKSRTPDDVWICCDLSAEALLAEKKLPFKRIEDYVSEATVEQIEKEARSRAADWFLGFGSPGGELEGGVRAESFFQKEFEYFLIGALKTFHLLEAIRKEHGACRLVTASSEPAPGVRLLREESTVAAWLRAEGERWNFDAEVISLARGQGRRAGFRVPGIIAALLLRASGGGCDALFSGNPSLLGPVREAFEKGGSCARHLKRFASWKHLLHLTDRTQVMLPEANAAAIPSKDMRNALRSLRYQSARLGVVLAERAESYYVSLHAPAAERYRSLLKMLRALSPKVVVMDEDVTDLGSSLAQAARTLGIRSLVVIHGIPGKPLGFVPSRAEKIASWGTFDKERLSSWGVDPDKIVVTGCPKYDSLARRAVGQGSEAPMVLLAPNSAPLNPFERFHGANGNPYERVEMVSAFLRTAEKTPKLSFVLKFHGETDDATVVDSALRLAGMKQLPFNFSVAASGPGVPLLRRASLLFCSCSSMVLEALVLKIPVAISNFSGFPNVFAFESYADVPVVRDYEQALKLCSQLAEGTFDRVAHLAEQEKLVEPFIRSRDGRSSERVAALVEEMAGAR